MIAEALAALQAEPSRVLFDRRVLVALAALGLFAVCVWKMFSKQIVEEASGTVGEVAKKTLDDPELVEKVKRIVVDLAKVRVRWPCCAGANSMPKRQPRFLKAHAHRPLCYLAPRQSPETTAALAGLLKTVFRERVVKVGVGFRASSASS